jgi:AcrR family transcriptional regulator
MFTRMVEPEAYALVLSWTDVQAFMHLTSTMNSLEVAQPATGPDPHTRDLKEACVQVAHEFIAENGIEHLSMRDVARKLGVSHQAPYRHYPSKDHLLAAVIARCFREFAQFLDARTKHENPEEDLASMGERYVTYASQHPLEYRLMFGTSWPPAAEDSELIRDSLHAFNLLRNVLTRIHGAGDAVREKVDLDAMFIWSNMHGLVTIGHCNVMRYLQLSPRVEHHVTQHVFAMIRSAMQSSNHGS